MAIGRTHMELLKREVARLDAENAVLKQTIRVRDADLWNAQQELVAATRPQPTELRDVLNELKGFVPTLPYAPGYSVLSTASDAKSFAQGLHLALLHARSVGYHEGKDR